MTLVAPPLSTVRFRLMRAYAALVTLAQPDGRRMLRIEARNAETPIERKPPWIKVTARMGPQFTALRGLVQREGLHTVCQEAGCPNIYECWRDGTATLHVRIHIAKWPTEPGPASTINSGITSADVSSMSCGTITAMNRFGLIRSLLSACRIN